MIKDGVVVDEPAAAPQAAGRSTLVNSAVADVMSTCLMQIECSFTRGFAGMQLIGNTTEVCRDGKERARAALEGLGIHIPPRRLVVSLTPADVKKDGNHFDLPLAVSLALLLKDQPRTVAPERWLFAAELGLGGELRPVRAVVSFAVAAMAGGLEGLVIAPGNLEEVRVLADLSPTGARPLVAHSFSTLRDVLAWIFDGQTPAVVRAGRSPQRRHLPPAEVNFDDMILPPSLELAALTVGAGMHSLLLRGSPGTGKSMLAARLASIIPNLPHEEHIEAMRIYSSGAERLPDALLAGRPPYRAPHHQASAVAVMGSPDTAGELALAHGGVLFLDELPEFRRDLLEALREPLESGEIRVARAHRKVIWKSRVVFVAACNNCACGWAGSARQPCTCSSARLHAYRQRLSGPILERIDLHVNVPEPDSANAELLLRLAHHDGSSLTKRLMARVQAARTFALRRNVPLGALLNRDLPACQLLAASGLSGVDFAALVNRRLSKSASSRSVIRCVRVARTLADLSESPVIREEHLDQAWLWQAERAAQARGECFVS